MASSGERFYQLEFRNREVLHGDVGSLIKIDGLVVGGGGAHSVLLLPSAPSPFQPELLTFHFLDVPEWSEWIQRSDQPEILVSGSPEKVFHRKVRYEISGAVQQKVWVADGCKCMYCGQSMGKVQLTIDHFIPLELGGVNNISNYLSACRRCNKEKGSEHPRPFLKSHKALGEYEFYVEYLRNRKVA